MACSTAGQDLPVTNWPAVEQAITSYMPRKDKTLKLNHIVVNRSAS